MGIKIFIIFIKQATSVVTATKTSGAIVTHAYFAFPRLLITDVPTVSAIAANNWLAVPNIGQIVETLPV
jgi:hypothetical protein